MQLNVLRLPPGYAGYHLALEHFLLTSSKIDPGDIWLLFYENMPSIILGKTLIKENEVKAFNPLPVLRRQSGGGSVVHGPGNFNFGIIASLTDYPDLFQVHHSYHRFLDPVAKSIKHGAVLGLSDISVMQAGTGRKISGNAQLRKNKRVLHHGTIIYDICTLRSYLGFLKHPPKEPDYRKGRRHLDFLLKAPVFKTPVQVQTLFIKALSKEFHLPVVQKTIAAVITNNSKKHILQLMNELYRPI